MISSCSVNPISVALEFFNASPYPRYDFATFPATLDYDYPIGKKDGRHLIPRAYEYFKKSVTEYAEGDEGQYKNNVPEQVDRIKIRCVFLSK